MSAHLLSTISMRTRLVTFLVLLPIVAGCAFAQPVTLDDVDAGGEKHYTGDIVTRGILQYLGDAELHYLAADGLPARTLKTQHAVDITIANQPAILHRLGLDALIADVDMKKSCGVSIRVRLRLSDWIVGPQDHWASARASDILVEKPARLIPCPPATPD